MTKRDFIALARILRESAEESIGNVEQSTVRRVTARVADYCATQNPRFDRERFLAACSPSVESAGKESGA